MRLLLDTHTFLWWLANDPRLSARARAAITDPDAEVFVSAASAWEITTKHRLGKLPGVAQVASDVAARVAGEGFRELPVSFVHAQHAGDLQGSHKRIRSIASSRPRRSSRLCSWCRTTARSTASA